MDILEIILLVAGGVIFVLSFIIPSKADKPSKEATESAKEEISRLVADEMEKVKGHVDDVVNEAVDYAMEKTERSLERLSNEKIMAVNEYSDTVLAEIHKNHEEAMFLYDMLNSKHTNLKDTVSEVNRTVKEAEETVNSFQRLVPEKVSSASEEQAQKPSEPSVTDLKTSKPEFPATDAKVSKLSEASAKKEDAKSGNAGKISESGAKAADAKVSKPSEASRKKEVTKAQNPGKGKKSAGTLPSDIESEEAEEAGRISFIGETGEEERNSNDKILELYRQGKSNVAIAKELGLGVGEVKLVIDLFKNQ